MSVFGLVRRGSISSLVDFSLLTQCRSTSVCPSKLQNEKKTYIYVQVALLSVYDKTNLLELARGLQESGVRLLGSGGTAKKIRDAGIPIE